MTRREALQEIIARLRRENEVLADERERLRAPRSTKHVRDIDRILSRMAMNEDVISECEAQLTRGEG